MKKLSVVALLLALSFAFAAQAVRATNPEPDAKPAIGAVVPDFTLPDADGKEHSLASLKGKSGTVIIFIATKCPVSNAYNERMQKLAEDYRAKGVNVVGINSNVERAGCRGQVARGREGSDLHHPEGPGNKIADRFDAQVTPEAYFLDASGKLAYRGRIDNSRNGDAITSTRAARRHRGDARRQARREDRGQGLRLLHQARELEGV